MAIIYPVYIAIDIHSVGHIINNLTPYEELIKMPDLDETLQYENTFENLKDVHPGEIYKADIIFTGSKSNNGDSIEYDCEITVENMVIQSVQFREAEVIYPDDAFL